ncbi:organic hydroperoxide resistance transcriptional regulator [Abditibacteriota bacterium]|nr:organic hydroperoxide resistance transcriptional regulator [Abditibacteriota bacterium]
MSHLTPADRDRIMQLLAADQPLLASDRELLFPSSSEGGGEGAESVSSDEDIPRDKVPPENWLCFSLYSTSLAVGKTYWPTLGKLGLTYPQLLALRQIRDGMTVNELGATIYLDSGTMTPLLKRLEVAGHIRRERDAKDERRVRLYLTEQGRKLRDEAVEEVGALLASASGWEKRDLRRLAGQISRFRAALLAKADDVRDGIPE